MAYKWKLKKPSEAVLRYCRPGAVCWDERVDDGYRDRTVLRVDEPVGARGMVTMNMWIEQATDLVGVSRDDVTMFVAVNEDVADAVMERRGFVDGMMTKGDFGTGLYLYERALVAHFAGPAGPNVMIVCDVDVHSLRAYDVGVHDKVLDKRGRVDRDGALVWTEGGRAVVVWDLRVVRPRCVVKYRVLDTATVPPPCVVIDGYVPVVMSRSLQQVIDYIVGVGAANGVGKSVENLTRWLFVHGPLIVPEFMQGLHLLLPTLQVVDVNFVRNLQFLLQFACVGDYLVGTNGALGAIDPSGSVFMTTQRLVGTVDDEVIDVRGKGAIVLDGAWLASVVRQYLLCYDVKF